jgi:hypothetical protein
VHTLKRDKGMHQRKEMLGIRIPYLVCIPRGVMSYCWLVGVTSSVNKGHALLSKWWLAFLAALPCQLG